ncbi:hypothetical protein JWG42_07650 [Desulfoprunum benzoelyticum]|uniref:Uncharacterized protein n=1 Tax=Desulfoprunum benzoelyticum TaxID=1506996 RepID=A0A840UV40_9BACT|nr:hypothetical protein [Desulfoprunum benzoelyticum]MBB5348703.1 hypothetical protein [Desulfoprunum benzoelyticum]MBM9530019.1 hypothetical protein [Desulfoprunum benzoelyticum]
MIDFDNDLGGLPALVLGDGMESHCPHCLEQFDFARAKMERIDGVMHCRCPDCCKWSIMPPAWETASALSFPPPGKILDQTDILRLIQHCDETQTEILAGILVKMATTKAQRWSGRITFVLDYHLGLLGDMQVNRHEVVRLHSPRKTGDRAALP